MKRALAIVALVSTLVAGYGLLGALGALLVAVYKSPAPAAQRGSHGPARGGTGSPG